MQVQNPQYKFYKKLAGTWKSNDSSCIVTLNEYAHLDITYGNARLDSSYSVLETGATLMVNNMLLPGFMGMSYEPHPGEELKVQMNNNSLSDGTRNLYVVNCLWYGNEKLNIELADSTGGQKITFVLTREGTEATPAATGYVCECGYAGPFGKFCPNCGRAVEEEYTCQCGYRSKGVKFCPNCGHPTGQSAASDSTQEAAAAATAAPGSSQDSTMTTKPSAPSVSEEPEEKLGWKCSRCGAENQEGKCSACGSAVNPVVLFSISTYMSTNPPVNTYTNVYEYSDTQLLLDCNGKRRLISTDVIEPAMAIIRKNRLDDPDFKDPSAMGIMGGSVSVGFKDGDKYVQTSLQTQGFAVTNAQNELMGLFNKA